MTDGTSNPDDEVTEGGKPVPAGYLVRPWAGKSYRGVFDISVPHVLEGWGGWIYGHESTHDSLMKTTPYGQVQLLLSMLDVPTNTSVEFASVGLLQQLLTEASLHVHEGAASYIGSLRSDEQVDLPPAYAEAVHSFDWMDERLEGSDVRLRVGLALTFARRALETPIAARWATDGLWHPQNLRMHLARPENNPTKRLLRVIDAASAMSRHELLAGLHLTSQDGWHSRAWRAGLPTSLPLVGAMSSGALADFAQDLVRALIDLHEADPRVTQIYARALAEGATSAIAPPHASVILNSAVLPPRPLIREDSARVLQGDLAVIWANPYPTAIPGAQKTDGSYETIPAHHAEVVGYFSDAEVVTNIPLAELSRFLDGAKQSTTICVKSQCYDFQAGEIVGISAPCLRQRRHNVFVEEPLWALLPRVTPGLAERDEVVVTYFPHAPQSALAYFSMTPIGEDTPVVLLPVLVEIQAEILREFQHNGMKIKAPTAPWSLERLRDFITIVKWFASNAPDVSAMFSDEQRETFRQRQRRWKADFD